MSNLYSLKFRKSFGFWIGFGNGFVNVGQDPLSMFDNSSSSDEEQLAPAHNNSLKINPDDDDPPGFSASDPESEPPGITDSSDSEVLFHNYIWPDVRKFWNKIRNFGISKIIS